MCLRPIWLPIVAAAWLAAAPVQTPAFAALLITVDKSAQRMIVEQDGVPMFEWPVSTGQRGYDTPSGEFKPFRMEKDHFSREWDDAPMPNSIFFTMQGHAIHGSNHVKAIGTPASHGCVRLEPKNAEILWRLVKQEKMANTRVILTGETPEPPPPPPAAAAPANKRTARANPENAGDPDFTSVLPGEPTRPPRYRGPDGAAFFDGHYYYDRRGRRIAEIAPPRERRWVYGRDYYERAQRGDPPPRRYRPNDYFPGWNSAR
jgi:hypothetical protein